MTTIVQIDKFGEKNLTTLSKDIFRATDLVILQENKQSKHCKYRIEYFQKLIFFTLDVFKILVMDYCNVSPCHPTALCTLSSSGRSCLCADNLESVLLVSIF